MGYRSYRFPVSLAQEVLAQYTQPWKWHRTDILAALDAGGNTQKELAAEMGATESQVSDWLRGRDGREPSIETRLRFDAALDELRELRIEVSRVKLATQEAA